MNKAYEFACEMLMESFTEEVGYFGTPDNPILAPHWSHTYWLERCNETQDKD